MDRSHLNRESKNRKVSYEERDSSSDEESYENIFFALEVFNEVGLGRGVRAKVRIDKRILLGEYTGKKISRSQAISRLNGNPCHYVVATSYSNRFIDGEGDMGNILKYVNHKCTDNNCQLVKLSKGRLGLQTTKVILPGDSLNYNYRHSYFEGHLYKQTKCLCCIECPNFF